MVQPFHTILSPVDFSKNTHLALAYTGYVARQCDATVHLLYVLPPTEGLLPSELYRPGKSGGADFGWAKTTAKEKVHTLAREHLGEGLRYEIHIRIGEAAPGILEMAEALEAGLIVMMTHSRTGLSRLLLGSVTEQVIRKSLCPVLTIPGQ